MYLGFGVCGGGWRGSLRLCFVSEVKCSTEEERRPEERKAEPLSRSPKDLKSKDLSGADWVWTRRLAARLAPSMQQ